MSEDYIEYNYERPAAKPNKTAKSKQTAVEWLVKQIENHIHHTVRIPREYVEQAKEIFKEQIIESHIHGHNAPSSTLKNFDAEQYYKEIFEGQDNE